MAAGMDFQMLQITLVYTVYSCVQQFGGASFVSYEPLMEKRHNKTSVNLMKHEAAVKMNYTNTCKNVYTFLLREEDILEAAQSNRKYVFFSLNFWRRNYFLFLF